MKVQLNTQLNSQQTFCGNHAKRGAKNIYQLMNKLYDNAYRNKLYGYYPDIIQISSKMKDGTEVSAVATFERGKFVDISFPYEVSQYRKEFCKKLLDKYNFVITKGKSSRHR